MLTEHLHAREYFKSFTWIASFYFPQQPPNEVYHYSLHFIDEGIKF